MNVATNRRPLIVAGILLGIGMGGFIDGIVFHQILQWHGMLTHQYPKVGVPADVAVMNMQINMFWDGIFHVATWTMTALGLVLLWRAGQRADVPWSTGTFIGALPLGWGMFNLVEGLIDHHVLHLHHVVEGPGATWWDFAFLMSGVILIAIGASCIHSARRDATPRAGFAQEMHEPAHVG